MFKNGYHHIGLKVTDADRSVKFYTEALGGEVCFQFPMGDSGKQIYMVDLGGNAVVEIIPNGTEDPEANARWAHICISAEDTRAAFDTAVKAGAKVQSEPKEGALGEKKICNAFIVGPDEEVIEFFQEMA